jgi:hypothetical protein
VKLLTCKVLHLDRLLSNSELLDKAENACQGQTLQLILPPR